MEISSRRFIWLLACALELQCEMNGIDSVGVAAMKVNPRAHLFFVFVFRAAAHRIGPTIVLTGRGLMTGLDETHELSPGKVISIPAHEYYEESNPNDEPMNLLGN